MSLLPCRWRTCKLEARQVLQVLGVVKCATKCNNCPRCQSHFHFQHEIERDAVTGGKEGAERAGGGGGGGDTDYEGYEPAGRRGRGDSGWNGDDRLCGTWFFFCRGEKSSSPRTWPSWPCSTSKQASCRFHYSPAGGPARPHRSLEYPIPKPLCSPASVASADQSPAFIKPPRNSSRRTPRTYPSQNRRRSSTFHLAGASSSIRNPQPIRR